MSNTPAFFVPNIPQERQEEAYADAAGLCGMIPLQLGERIYSINFLHDGVQWTATVGENLRGVRHKITRSRGKTVEHRIPVSDSAMVIAIFPGIPYKVVTNAIPFGTIISYWVNPFLAGTPSSVVHFSS